MRSRRIVQSAQPVTSSSNFTARSEKSGRFVRLFIGLFMLFGLMAPYANLAPVSASPGQSSDLELARYQQRDNTPPPLQGVLGVAVSGDVADLVGNVPLINNGVGIWTGSAALSPGQYEFTVVVSTSAGDIELGQGGLPVPPANQALADIPDNAPGAIFAFNQHTGALSAGGLIFEIQTDVGQFQLIPDGQGNYEAYFDAPAGSPITYQPVVAGQPTGESGQVTADNSGRVHIVVNANGQVVVSEAVQTAALTIVKIDENGTPLTGACFAAYGGGNSVLSQACDATDGNFEGVTLLRFPNGVPTGSVDIVEILTPADQATSSPQSVGIPVGSSQLQMVAASGVEAPVEEPVVDPGVPTFSLTFFPIDLNGVPLPGACFAVDGGEPVCDDDGDGLVVITNVPAGTRVLSEPTPPQGFEAYPDTQLEVTRDEQFSVPHNVATGPPPDLATIGFASVDDGGNGLPGACYALDSGQSACDDDGHGVATFTGVDFGNYGVSQTRAPDGYEPVESFSVQVEGDQTFQVAHQRSPEPTPVVEEPEVFTVGFVSVDSAQNGLPFACYTLDGSEPRCDDDGDSIVTFENTPAGQYSLTQTRVPEGYENVGTLDVTIDSDRNFAVPHDPVAEPEEPVAEPTEVPDAGPTEEPVAEPTEEPVDGLTVGFVSVDQDDNGLPGACFRLDEGPEVCDDDGDAEVTFRGVQPGPYVLTQTQPPVGYQSIGEVPIDLQNDGRFAIRHQPLEGEPDVQLGELAATTVDQDGTELPGVCYQIFTFGEQCDGDDEDRVMTQTDMPAGDYTIELVVPDGYVVVGDASQTVTVEGDQRTDVQFQVQVSDVEEPVVEEPTAEPDPTEVPVTDGEGAIQAVALEEDFPVIDACIQASGPADVEVCDNQQGDENPEQGVVLITGLPAGDYQVSMPNPPAGFDPAPPIPATVTDGGVADVQLEVGGVVEEEPVAPETGVLMIEKVDETGSLLSGACFQIGDGPEVCDNGDGDADGQDGVIRVEGLPVGDLALSETVAPPGFIAGDATSATINAGEETSVQILNSPEPPVLGSFRVVKREPDRSRIAGTCFALVGEETLGPWCDDGPEDVDERFGVMEILDIPVGDYTLTETQAAEGFLLAPDEPITIVEGERTSVTVINEFAEGSLEILKTDVDGNPLVGACFDVGDALSVCDNDDADAAEGDGRIVVRELPIGEYVVTEQPFEGFVNPDPQTVTIIGGERVSVTFVNVLAIGTVVIQKLDENGTPLGGACFSIAGTTICDNGDRDENDAEGFIQVSGVAAGEVTILETVSPEGYRAALETETVTVVTGETVSATFTNIRLVGAVLIEKVDDAGVPLGGACFSVGDVEVCDNGDGDENDEAGVILVSGFPIGIVSIVETAAPEGYRLSAEPQTVEIVTDETTTLSFTNTLMQGALQILKVDEAGEPIGGSCFSIDGQEICDNSEADESNEAGVIELSGLSVAEIEIFESTAPDGYGGATGFQNVEIVDNETVTVSFVNVRLVGRLEISKVDESGNLIAGACFSVAGQEICDNGGGDLNSDDGVMLVGGIPTGPVTVVETSAPTGYAVSSDEQSVEIVSGDTVVLTFANTRLLGELQIEKVDEAGEPLPGGCFSVDDLVVCDNGDGDLDEAPGIVQISGILVGSVEVRETQAPQGYAADSEAQSVQIDSEETATVTFANARLFGSVEIEKVNDAQEPLEGACFSIGGREVCDNGDGDENEEPGFILVSGVPTGIVEVVETVAPDGYRPGAQSQRITVQSETVTNVVVTNIREVGSVEIFKIDETGAPLGGSCFLVGDVEVCDNGEGDENEEVGLVQRTGIPTGTITIAETIAPSGYRFDSDPESIEIVAYETTAVTVTNVMLQGSLTIFKVNEADEPLGNSCFRVGGQEICDNGELDENDQDGVIEVSGLPVGEIEIFESTEPEGYRAATGARSVEIVDNETATVSFINARQVGSLEITKVDESGDLLAGACFDVAGLEVCDNGGGDLNSDDGLVLVSGIPTGEISVAESSALEGYTADSAEQTVAILNGETSSVTFTNTRLLGDLTIQNVDQDGVPLGGACFSLGDLDVCDNDETDIDDEPGIVRISGIPTGSYDVIESQAPAGYSAEVEAQTVLINANEPATVTFINTRQFGSIEIIKVNEAGESLGGACFSINGQDVCDNGNGDENEDPGVILVSGISVGAAEVNESVAPEGYAVSGGSQTVEIGVDATSTATFSNTRLVGTLIIEKVDEAGELLGGACFTIDDVEICDNGEGDENEAEGSTERSGIPTGVVVVVETSAPDGYVAAAGGQDVTILADETVTVTIENAVAVGSLEIVAQNEDEEALSDACFSIDGTAVCDNDAADENPDDGMVLVSGLRIGSVTVTETVAPEGYIAPADSQTVDIVQDETTTVTFVNPLATGTLRVFKTDQDGEPLEGSCFAVGTQTVCDNDSGDQSSESGVVVFADVPIGTYELIESQVPDGYRGDDESTEVLIITGEVTEATVANSQLVGVIQITKVDINNLGVPIGGACFSVEGTEIEVCDNDALDQDPADGIIRVESVPVGRYQLVESRAPEGYRAGSQLSVAIVEGEVTLRTVGNVLIAGSIRILKVDAADGATVLGGSCFRVDDGDPVCDNEPDDLDPASGLIEIGGLLPGAYEVVETTAPAGFLPGPAVTVEVPEGTSAEVTVTNERSEGSIRIEKSDDETGELIGGACFSVDGNEPVCDNDANDADPADGVLQIVTTPGNRIVQETTAPEGYDGLVGPQSVDVPGGGSVTVQFPNTRFTGSLSIVKTDNSTDEPLSGACFTVSGEETVGPVCDNDASDADGTPGTVLIQGLAPGVYSIVETATPSGYTPPAGPVAENVQVAGGTVKVVDVANEPEGAPVPLPANLGDLEIRKTNEDGAALAGACFSLIGDTTVGPVCDGQEGDSSLQDGTISISGIPAGDYLLEESTAPEGYAAGPVQTVTIVATDTVRVDVTNVASEEQRGSLQIQSTDGAGQDLGGACYSNGLTTFCDNEAGDEDPAPGIILVSGIPVGDFTITQTQTPTGFVQASPLPVTIKNDQQAGLVVPHEVAPAETGGLEFELNDTNGNAVAGACVALTAEENQGPDLVACDGGPEDQDPAPGVLRLEGLPVGVWSVGQTSLPGDESAVVAGVSFKMSVLQADDQAVAISENPTISEKVVTVKPNIIVLVIIIIIIEPPQTGTLEIVKRSLDTNILQSGACFEVTGQGNTIEICDNDGVDANMTLGVIRFLNLPEGVFTISETQAPAGYDPVADQDVAIVGGLITTITVKNPPVADPLGDLVVLKVDPDGGFILGTCFELRQGSDVFAGPVCDEDDGDDGTITFADIEPGDYTLRETQAASPNYQTVADQPVTVQAGQEIEIPIVNTLKPGSILITKVDDESGVPLSGACFGLDRGDGIEFEICDQQPGDGDLQEGKIRFSALPPGEYTLIETQAPPGFDSGATQQVIVEANTLLMLEVANTASVPPVDTGSLTIIKRNETGEPLFGTCFALRQGPVIKVASRCDIDDGLLDGRITFESVGVGQYGVIETKKPSPEYQTPPEKFVTVTKDQSTSIVIVNVLQRGRILVQKVNQQDAPLANACFKVTPGIHPMRCSDGAGNVVFDALKPGVYTVTETQAPYGYLTVPPVTSIVVKPGLTTPVKIVNKKAPPPADAGSLRVIKFFCPLVGDSENLTQVFNSADPNKNVLAQTANCKKGDVTFVLKPKTPGDLVSIKFVTGSDGIAHLTLPAGSYTMTEQGTNVTVDVRVFVGQQTTVVVLNYVAPPPPAPVRINVYKYTCDPGFQGQFYLDFIGSCGAFENLTNNVTFRISGAAIASRVTGDGGERGRTLFSQLPPGLYTLKEDVPPGAGTTYVWCGLTIDGYELGAIGNQVSFPLSSGQTMWCAFFNVPDQVTDSTGSIVIHKYGCELPAVKRPANFDWFGECGLQTTGAKFSLSELQDGIFVPRFTGVANTNGILSFNDLRSGTYRLKEVGADWCHAESDSVNVDGDVLVSAGKRSNVWIFNCVPTVKPPNTGAGVTASMNALSPGPAETAGQDPSLLLAWPLIGVFGLLARKRVQARAA
ncbi:hypothetical protein BH23CHL5_BH23CHL5_00970 [soil metagenome]